MKAAKDLDRGVSSARWSADGKSLTVLVADDRNVYPARVPVSGGSAERLMAAPVVVSNPTVAAACSAVLSGGDSRHNEVYAVQGGSLRQLTHQNDELFAQLDIPPTEEVSFKSKDGAEIHGLLTYPVGYVKGTKVPLLLRIHGGPNGQDAHQFSVERQVFAANDPFSPYLQYSDTPSGTYLCTALVDPGRERGFAVTLGVQYEDSRYFRGRDTTVRMKSSCPAPECCQRPPARLAARWEGQAWPSARAHSHVLSVLPSGAFPGVDDVDIYEFLDRHAAD